MKILTQHYFFCIYYVTIKLRGGTRSSLRPSRFTSLKLVTAKLASAHIVAAIHMLSDGNDRPFFISVSYA